MLMTVVWCVVMVCHRFAVGVISHLLQSLRDVDGKGTKRESYCPDLHLLICSLSYALFKIIDHFIHNRVCCHKSVPNS